MVLNHAHIHTLVYEGLGTTLGIVPGTSSALFESGSLPGLELTSWFRLAGQQAPESTLSTPSQLWHYNYIHFYVGSGDQTQVLGKYSSN